MTYGYARNYYSDMVGRRTCVYRLYDSDNNLLYVGLSLNPKGRIPAHRRKSWGSQIARQEIEWFDGREAAKDVERRAIATEHPAHNIVGVATNGVV